VNEGVFPADQAQSTPGLPMAHSPAVARLRSHRSSIRVKIEELKREIDEVTP